jgi:hypothetical protein
MANIKLTLNGEALVEIGTPMGTLYALEEALMNGEITRAYTLEEIRELSGGLYYKIY